VRRAWGRSATRLSSRPVSRPTARLALARQVMRRPSYSGRPSRLVALRGPGQRPDPKPQSARSCRAPTRVRCPERARSSAGRLTRHRSQHATHHATNGQPSRSAPASVVKATGGYAVACHPLSRAVLLGIRQVGKCQYRTKAGAGFIRPETTFAGPWCRDGAPVTFHLNRDFAQLRGYGRHNGSPVRCGLSGPPEGPDGAVPFLWGRLRRGDARTARFG
jgi:hypothetical protein